MDLGPGQEWGGSRKTGDQYAEEIQVLDTLRDRAAAGDQEALDALHHQATEYLWMCVQGRMRATRKKGLSRVQAMSRGVKDKNDELVLGVLPEVMPQHNLGSDVMQTAKGWRHLIRLVTRQLYLDGTPKNRRTVKRVLEQNRKKVEALFRDSA